MNCGKCTDKSRQIGSGLGSGMVISVNDNLLKVGLDVRDLSSPAKLEDLAQNLRAWLAWNITQEDGFRQKIAKNIGENISLYSDEKQTLWIDDSHQIGLDISIYSERPPSSEIGELSKDAPSENFIDITEGIIYGKDGEWKTEVDNLDASDAIQAASRAYYNVKDTEFKTKKGKTFYGGDVHNMDEDDSVSGIIFNGRLVYYLDDRKKIPYGEPSYYIPPKELMEKMQNEPAKDSLYAMGTRYNLFQEIEDGNIDFRNVVITRHDVHENKKFQTVSFYDNEEKNSICDKIGLVIPKCF